MKKLFTLLLLLLPLSTFGQELKVIETDIFTVGYSEALEQPVWVEYKVLCPNGQAERTGMDFYEDENIHTSDDDDYSNNEWDKGHMAPASAFSCDKEMLKKTFTYLNSALQHEGLNRGVWNRLEAFERDLGNFFDVNVRIDVIFGENAQVLPSGATVPTGFIKTIKFDGKTAVFEFPNEKISGQRWIDFIVTNPN
jgi:DNA/RNA endonuclease G (NUC1)